MYEDDDDDDDDNHGHDHDQFSAIPSVIFSVTVKLSTSSVYIQSLDTFQQPTSTQLHLSFFLKNFNQAQSSCPSHSFLSRSHFPLPSSFRSAPSMAGHTAFCG